MSEMSVLQGRIFCCCLVCGLFTGLWYDLLRTLRMMIRHNDFWVQVEDIMFIFTAATGLFVLIHKYNHGSIRLYILLGTALGILVYRAVFHPLTGYLLKKLMTAILNVLKILVIILVWPAKKTIKCIYIILKNTFRTVRMINSRM
ncbi:MAG: spore cortex biosynthesis protein YabQ [Eubacterium sp.]|nr:spore cortex biosynthesis protein YabQ [Eubacterium sp.]